MPYNLDIPGQVSEFQLKAIEAVASLVPGKGCVVEVGSLFGRSSWAWAKSVPPDTDVFCIDPWEVNRGVAQIERDYKIKYGLEQFKAYTADCPNIHPMKAYSPAEMENWTRKIDLYYEDAVHTNPILESNISFWKSHLEPTGIICGDDYRPRFPDVVAAAERLAAERGSKLRVVDFFWCVLPDERLVKGVAEVVRILEELGERSRAANAERLKFARLQVVPLSEPFPAELSTENKSEIPIRVANNGMSPWPTTEGGEIQLYKKLLSGETVLAEERVGTGVNQLLYDVALEVPVRIPFGANAERADTLEIGIVGELPARSQMMRVPLKIVKPSLYKIGDTIALRCGLKLPLALVEGWSPPEQKYVRSVGTQSHIIIYPEGSDGPKWLKLQILPFVVPSDPVRGLTIEVDGISLMACELTGLTTVSIPVSVEIGRAIDIRFSYNNPVEPREVLPSSTDSRKLSIALINILIS